MSAGVPLNAAHRTVSIAAADLNDTDAVLTALASDNTPASLALSDLDGAGIVDQTVGGLQPLPRTLTVSTTASAATYNTSDPIVIRGRRGGKEVFEEFLLTDAGGNETIRGKQAFDTVIGNADGDPAVFVPLQLDAGGDISIGFGDICCPLGQLFAGVELHALGTLNVQYGDGDGSPVDAKPCAAHQFNPMAPSRVLTDAELDAPTTVGVTVFIP